MKCQNWESPHTKGKSSTEALQTVTLKATASSHFDSLFVCKSELTEPKSKTRQSKHPSDPSQPCSLHTELPEPNIPMPGSPPSTRQAPSSEQPWLQGLVKPSICEQAKINIVLRSTLADATEKATGPFCCKLLTENFKISGRCTKNKF